MDCIMPKEAAEKWGISERRVQKLCEEDRIPGVIRFGRSWAIPKEAEKPVDARKKNPKKNLANEKRLTPNYGTIAHTLIGTALLEKGLSYAKT